MLIIKIAVWVFMFMLLAGIVAYYIDQQREFKANNTPTPTPPPARRCEVQLYQAPEKKPTPVVPVVGLQMETTFYDPAVGADVTIMV